MNPILILVFQILHIFKNNMQKKFFRLVKFLIFKTILNFTLFENLELHEIKAGPGSSDVH